MGKRWILILICSLGLGSGCGADRASPGLDADGDGFSVLEGDCADSDPSIYPGAAEIPNDGIDQDCDGKDAVDSKGLDLDGDGVSAADGDCDDRDPKVYPGATERCDDGIDQDCDGKDAICAKDDGDGDGFTPEQGDCDDGDPAVHPGATETPYNGADDDCDPKTPDDDLDGDGYGKVGGADCDDNDPAGYPGAKEIPYDGKDQDCSGGDLIDIDGDGEPGVQAGGSDCDDENPLIKKGGVEVCADGIDQDCDGKDLPCDQADQDGDGYSPAQGDCNDADPAINPGAKEIYYNGVDDDCDVKTNDADADGDGFSKFTAGDCNDNDKTVHPAAPEIPYDGVDQDCDGADLIDVDGDGYPAKSAGGDDCDDQDAAVNPKAQEIPYDGVDQDCDGLDIVSAGVVTQQLPSVDNLRVAASGNQHLALYRYSINGKRRLEVLRADATGKAVGAPLIVRESSNSIDYPVVAGLASGWLVAWREYAGSSNYLLYGQRVGSDGKKVGGLITIAAAARHYRYDLAMSATSGHFVLVWRQRNYPTSGQVDRIRVQFIKADGSLDGAQHAASPSSWYAGEPQVAGAGAEALVVWRQNRGQPSGNDIFARRYQPAGPVGVELSVADTSASESAPRVAASGGQYLVSWGRDSYVYGQRISGSGALSGGVIDISLASGGYSWPQLGACQGSFFFSYASYRFGASALFLQRVDSAGKLQGASANNNELVYAEGYYLREPTTSCASGGPIIFFLENSSTGRALRAVTL